MPCRTYRMRKASLLCEFSGVAQGLVERRATFRIFGMTLVYLSKSRVRGVEHNVCLLFTYNQYAWVYVGQV
jgi:hypothetical protein